MKKELHYIAILVANMILQISVMSILTYFAFTHEHDLPTLVVIAIGAVTGGFIPILIKDYLSLKTTINCLRSK